MTDHCGNQADCIDPADCTDPEFFAECEALYASNDEIDIAELTACDDSIASDDYTPF